jgi:hypothetical protein
MMLARMAFFFGGRDDRNGSSPFGGLLMLILAPIAAMLDTGRDFAVARVRRRCRRPRAGGIPDGLVRALKKIEAVARRVPLDANPATAHMFIVQPFSGQALFSLFSTHPPTEKADCRADCSGKTVSLRGRGAAGRQCRHRIVGRRLQGSGPIHVRRGLSRAEH